MPWTYGDTATAATALVGLAALVRPDISRAFRHWRAQIDVHMAGQIEVGFSNFGPTVGVQGTLRSISRDEFISKSWVTVERLSDHSRHDFDWAVFRPQALSPTPGNFEIAAGFLLSPAAPHRFNIQFHDTTTAEKIRAPLMTFQTKWLKYLEERKIILTTLPPNDLRKVYESFASDSSSGSTEAYQALDRDFYWIPGDYGLRLYVKTSRPEKIFSYEYAFHLSELDSNTVRFNVIACILAICNMPDITFNFAYPAYKTATAS